MKKVYENKRSELEALCQDISAFGSEFFITEEDLFALHLVVEEIFINIVDYGFDDNQPHSIEIDLKFNEGDIVLITIKDKGKPFNPLTDTQAPNLSAPLATRQAGGLGVHFMKQMMDHVDYQRIDTENTLTLTKKVTLRKKP